MWNGTEHVERQLVMWHCAELVARQLLMWHCEELVARQLVMWHCAEHVTRQRMPLRNFQDELFCFFLFFICRNLMYWIHEFTHLMYCQVDREACCSLAVSIIFTVIIIIIMVLFRVCAEMASNDFGLCILVYDTKHSHCQPACNCWRTSTVSCTMYRKVHETSLYQFIIFRQGIPVVFLSLN